MKINIKQLTIISFLTFASAMLSISAMKENKRTFHEIEKNVGVQESAKKQKLKNEDNTQTDVIENSKPTGIEQKKTTIENILNTTITIEASQQHIALYNAKNEKIATSSFYLCEDNVYLSDFQVTENYRKRGIGQEFFHLSMYHIRQTYPDQSLVTWLSLSKTNDDELLRKFYLKVGAHKASSNDYYDFYIHLKEDGYHDEN